MSNDIEIVKAFKVGNKLFPDKESAEKEEMRLCEKSSGGNRIYITVRRVLW